mgnify:CR=1 FL=1
MSLVPLSCLWLQLEIGVRDLPHNDSLRYADPGVHRHLQLSPRKQQRHRYGHFQPDPMNGLIDAGGAIGILTITPSEAAMIAADVATKAADVKIGFVDRFNGSLVITGDVAAVQAALTDVMSTLCGMMGFASAPITKT